METRYFMTLQAILESGSFSQAAKKLNLTQSAVSQRVRFMEEQYGVPLVDRSGAVITATTAGWTVLRKALKILSLEKELQGELKKLETKSDISFCCTPTFGIAYLSLVLNRFFLINSQVNVKSALKTTDEVIKEVLGNDFDVAVVEHCDILETYDAVTFSLPPDELTFISAPSLGLSGNKLLLSELLDQRIIARREGCSSRTLLQDNLAKFGKQLDDFRGVDIHHGLYLTIQETLAGHGVAFASRSLVEDLLAKGELLEHTVDGFRYFRSRTLIINRRCSEDKLVRNIIECVHDVFGLSCS